MKAIKHLLTYILILSTTSFAFAEDPHLNNKILNNADQVMQNPDSSPVRRIERDPNKQRKRKSEIFYRTIDGSYNNLTTIEMNAAETPLRRLTIESYADGSYTMAGPNRPNVRTISNLVMSQSEPSFTQKRASDFLWQWGQFLDHDIDITDGVHPEELENIMIPKGDPHFDQQEKGDVVLKFNRSIYKLNSSPRQQLNEITGWIDASNVYGSNLDRANELRRLDGSGKLKTSKKGLLPFNINGLPNAGGPSEKLFLAGDVRANEQIGLTAMHTLFVREHNRLAREIRRTNKNLSGEEIYQRARRIVAAQMQVITYKEFIPVLLGKKALSKYKGYNPNIDARISNEFSTAAYRLGHSLLSPQILRLNKRGKTIKHGNLSLREAFFAPSLLTEEGNIGPILRGLAVQACQDLDVFIVDDVRNFLFGQPDQGGFDLASLNIQRGRDHGLPSYNDTRRSLDLKPASEFSDISSNVEIQQRLQKAYNNNIELVDLWVGGLAEDKVDNALVGEVFFIILKDQFERLRDGDRFWYQNYFHGKDLKRIKKTTLAKIIQRNTSVGDELQKNVFLTRK